MALGPRLDLRQSQSLVMTPQLQQAIRLLTLSNLEVEAFIAEELEKNPLLETDGVEVERREADESGDAEVAAPELPDTDNVLEGNGDAGEALDVDLGAETFHHDGPSDSAIGSGGDGSAYSDEGPDFDSFAAEDISLQDHLFSQASMRFAGIDLLIARHLIELIDEAGYLQTSLLDVADRLGVPRAQVERVLEGIHGFDPTGVGARSLSECLALQLRELDRYDPAMARLVENLDLLAQGRLSQLQRMCGVDDEDMADMIRELRALDPKPGLRFSHESTQAITPDLFVAERADGWAVEINSASLPRLLVNRRYFVEVSSDGHQDKASKAWLNECMANAQWLVKTLDQRQRTIIKVASEIVKQQQGFFREGVAHLKPLNLRQIAENVGLHESTVSRVTSNKYLSCSRGMFELKYFFSSGIASSDGGEAVSAEAVKNAIRSLINAESSSAILSDDTLAELLKQQGFDAARRTVAKYREAMGIGSSVQRRRAKALQAKAA